MDNQFRIILSRFNNSDKELVGRDLITTLKIGKEELIDYNTIEQLIERKITDIEKYQLDILYRVINYNPRIYMSGGGGSGEEEE